MNRLRLSCCLILTSLLLALANNGLAQQPGNNRPPVERRKWTADHAYNITPNAGAWAICVMSYSGEHAFYLSEKFVTELRRDYRLPGYFFNRGDSELQKEIEREEKMRRERWKLYTDLAKQMGEADPAKVAPEKIRVKKPLRFEEQFAVLIGGYRDMESARRSLEYVKKQLKPPSEELMNKAFVAAPANGGAEVKSAFINPFLSAFVVPNPTAPRPKPAEADEGEQDVSLKDLNADETYSLLKCPGTWTLVVKKYQAPTIVLSQGQDRSPFTRGKSRGGEFLRASERQAHQLAEVLRTGQLGFDAYALHANNMSMVTVGSFSGPNDPEMEKTANRIARLKLEPYETLMNPPMPFKVPKPK